MRVNITWLSSCVIFFHDLLQLIWRIPFIVGFLREPTGLVHIFIDNSNVEIEGKKLVSNLENVFKDQLFIEYGRLLEIVYSGRTIGDNPIIVRSRSPSNDSLQKKIEYLGFRVEVYNRSVIDHRAKEVDSELKASICDAIQEYKRPGTIVLVAGDSDYGPMLRQALLRNWSVEIWFWTKGNEILRLWIINSLYSK